MEPAFLRRTIPFCLLAFLLACRSSADWPQFRGPVGVLLDYRGFEIAKKK
jgi:hypothetical protein